MKEITVLSWGGGTQSTALMLMILNGDIEVKKPDYIIFSDTGDESAETYEQVYKVKKYVKDTYNVDILITSKNKVKTKLDDVVSLLKLGKIEDVNFRSSKYADLYQEQVLFYKGLIDQAHLVPAWIYSKGKLGKLLGKKCTVAYKISQIMKEVRVQENIKRFSKTKHLVKMYIGFTFDELQRVKPSPESYVTNVFPLVDKGLSKQDCIDYVNQKLGFKPKSSVCNMCFANNFERVYNLYKYDKEAWSKLLVLDAAMEENKQTKLRADSIWMFQWQAKLKTRLKYLDMEDEYLKRTQTKEQYDIYKESEQNACMGGCFI